MDWDFLTGRSCDMLVGRALSIVSYTCISCACCIFLMIDYGCTKVVMKKLMLILVECIVMKIWLVTYCYMFLTCHCMPLDYIFVCLITCIILVGFLQELIAYAWLYVLMHMCSWLGITYACWWCHVAMCIME